MEFELTFREFIVRILSYKEFIEAVKLNFESFKFKSAQFIKASSPLNVTFKSDKPIFNCGIFAFKIFIYPPKRGL